MPVIRKKLTETEGAPANTRANPETGEVETTTDGGTTWTPNPDADPRTNPAYQLEAIPGNQCPAAAGMILQMRDFVTNVFGGTTAIGIAGSALLALTLMLPGAGWLFSVALLIASATVTAGAGVILASFTEPVWDDLLCLLYCHLDDDGLFTQEQIDAFIADVYADLGDSVGFGVAQMIQAWGFVGFNNAGILRADDTADCSGCTDCGWAMFYNSEDGNGNFAGNITGGGGYWVVLNMRYIPGVGWVSGVNQSINAGETYNMVGIGFGVANMTITKIRLYFRSTKGVSVPAGDSPTRIFLNSTSPSASTLDTGGYLEWDGSFGVGSLGASMGFESANAYRNDGTPAGGGSIITGILFQGVGAAPALLGPGWSYVTPI